MSNVHCRLLRLFVKVIKFDVFELLVFGNIEFLTLLPCLSEVAVCAFRVIFLGYVSVALWVPRSIESILRFIKATLDLLSLVEVVADSESFIFSTRFFHFCVDAALSLVFLTARITKRGLPTRL